MGADGFFVTAFFAPTPVTTPLGMAGRVRRTGYRLIMTSTTRKKLSLAKSSGAAQPAQPYPGFSVFPRGNCLWAKTFRGRIHHFGRVVDDGQTTEALHEQ